MRISLFALLLVPLISFADNPPIIIDVSSNITTIPIPVLNMPMPPRIQAQLDIGSESAFVYDLTTNETVYTKNSTDQKSIASITKMMTAYLVLSEKEDMDRIITLTQADIALSNKGSAGSHLRAGMSFTRERLLNLALMSSENRAAAALGRTTFPGGVEEFVSYMNQMAKVLKMDHTHFVDPIGIGEGNQSTAEDLVKLIAAASEVDMIRDFSTTKWKEVELPVGKRHARLTPYHNTNALVGFRDWNILVQKTGFTNAAGHCVVMIVEIEGHKYAVVELNSPTNQQRAFDAIKLRHYLEEGEELSASDIRPLSPYEGILISRNWHPSKKLHHVKHHHRINA